MKMRQFTLATLLLVFATGITLSQAQTTDSTVKVTLQADSSSFTVNGNSTLHHWSAKATPVQGEFMLPAALWTPGADAANLSFTTGTVSVASKSIDSGEGGMNKKIYGAMDVKKYPEITYSLEKATLTGVRDSSNVRLLSLNTTGKLTIHGVTQEISMPVSGILDGNTITFNGSRDFKMTDFKVDPPSALFGTIKAANEITVLFHIKAVK